MDIKQFRLNSVENCRKSIGRLVKARFNDEIGDITFKSMIHGLNVMVSYWKLEKEISYEQRLDELEAILKKDNKHHVN